MSANQTLKMLLCHDAWHKNNTPKDFFAGWKGESITASGSAGRQKPDRKRGNGCHSWDQCEVFHLPSKGKTNSLQLERRRSQRRDAQRAGPDVHKMTRKLTLAVAIWKDSCITPQIRLNLGLGKSCLAPCFIWTADTNTLYLHTRWQAMHVRSPNPKAKLVSQRSFWSTCREDHAHTSRCRRRKLNREHQQKWCQRANQNISPRGNQHMLLLLPPSVSQVTGNGSLKRHFQGRTIQLSCLMGQLDSSWGQQQGKL